MGRATPAHFGTQHTDRTNEVAMSKDQMPSSSHLSGSVGEDPLMITRGNEPSILRMNGGTAPDSSMLGSRDEKLKSFSREHLDPFLESELALLTKLQLILIKCLMGKVMMVGRSWILVRRLHILGSYLHIIHLGLSSGQGPGRPTCMDQAMNLTSIT
ncbi:UNVERIFIED_CONTAM: hypothetical protein Sradi_0168200 [Sesamum radiatum]|uniref:Uncharacterized protein n=1 Tax=Sesamum radiatum TaxID=300843 RepID=A0AAW2VZU7_SESRA